MLFLATFRNTPPSFSPIRSWFPQVNTRCVYGRVGENSSSDYSLRKLSRATKSKVAHYRPEPFEARSPRRASLQECGLSVEDEKHHARIWLEPSALSFSN